ncbi:MAG: hypothetical protein KC609_03410 [Myxococcales bacterium]|nr:hypothetical protein [Myxococcales bacterium]
MLVQCIRNRIEQLSDDGGLRQYFESAMPFADGVVPLKPGALYLVYGLEVRQNGVWYYVLDGDASTPHPYTARLFSVVDRRLSRHWEYEKLSSNGAHASAIVARLVFPEWASDDDFQTKLASGDEEATSAFALQRAKIDVEFPSPAVDLPGFGHDAQHVECPTCHTIFSTDSTEGVLSCPTDGCGTLMRNPNFQSGVIPLY